MHASNVPLVWSVCVEAWLVWLASAGRPQTTRDLRAYQVRRLAAEIGIESPLDVTVDDLAEWLASKDWSNETKRSCRSAATTFYDWLVVTGRMKTNPARLLPSIRPGIGRPRPTPEDVLRAALDEADDRERLMLTLAARMGLRRGEIARVHARDVTESQWGHVLRVHGKGDKVRVIPLSPELARSILTAADGGWVFPNGLGGHLTPAHVGKLVSHLMPEGWTCHTLRHRFATRAYGAQRDLLAVQELLGHSSPTTTRRYVELPPDSLRAAMAAA